MARRRDSFSGERQADLTRGYTGTRDLTRSERNAGSATTNRDRSVTTTRRTSGSGATNEERLTTRGGVGGAGNLRYERTNTRGGRTTTESYQADRDTFGRTSTTQSESRRRALGSGSETQTQSIATDRSGRRTTTESTASERVRGTTTTTTGTSTRRGPSGEVQTGRSRTEARTEGAATTTTTRSTTRGSSTTRADTATTADGRLSLGSSVDRRIGERRTDISREHTRGPEAQRDQGVTQQDRLHRGQQGADLANGLLGDSARHSFVERRAWDTAGVDALTPSAADRQTSETRFAGALHGTQGAQHLDVGVNGASGRFMRGASAGLYAQANDHVEGRYGQANYQAGARLEARASVDARGTLNSNGLDATVTARAGVSAEASLRGQAQTQPVTFAGEELRLGVEGTVRVRAEASAEATATVRATRHPPAAVLEGTVGASAVVRAEAEVTASAGPFAVRASGYGSAGAEARASGTIGYENGRLRIGGSAGAALGLGLGGAVNVEVDVAQIGRMAHTAADRNGDGRLGLDDVGAGARQAATNTRAAVSSAASTVRGWFGW